MTVEADGSGSRSIRRVDDLSGIIADLDSGRLGAVAIDIPIGLPDEGSRRCDLEARKLIGPRRSSVFPAPFRSVLGALTYEDAAARCRAVSGKSLSLQAFGILPKIAEVDRLMTRTGNVTWWRSIRRSASRCSRVHRRPTTRPLPKAGPSASSR